MKNHDSPLKAYDILFTGVVGVSFAAILIRYASAPAGIIAFYRLFFAALLTLPYTILYQHRTLSSLKQKELLLAVLSGIFLAMHFYTWIKSLELTTIASSTVLVSLQPVFTMVLGYLLYQETLQKVSMVGMAAAIFGSIMMGISDLKLDHAHLIGDLLALSGGFFGSCYIIIGRKLRNSVPAATYCTLVYGICAITLLLINLVLRTPLRGYGTNNLLIFLALAVICTIGGHSIFNWSLKHLKAVTVSTASLGEPIGATLLAYLLFRESPGTMQLLSGSIILFGLYLFLKGIVGQRPSINHNDAD